MACEVKVIADSINPYNGIRLTTFQLKYWRSIHSELMTHRVFSRNASSSRAIPVAKMIEQVRFEPSGPIHWGKNQPGMKAREELDQPQKISVQSLWLEAANSAADIAEKMMNEGVHKQVANRILEPFQYISVIVTATDWDNWFELRDHHDAQPEIQELAIAMHNAMNESKSRVTFYHLPYITDKEQYDHDVVECMQMSAARCARVSYLTHDGKAPSIEKDLKLYNDLVGSVPLHASPTEHQAMAKTSKDYIKNFRGWKQHRVDVEATINNLKQK